MIGLAARGADLQEAGGLDRAGIEDQAGDCHAVHVGHRDDRQAACRDQRGDAETEDDGVGPGDPQRVVERVNARREQDVLARGQRGVDARRRSPSRAGRCRTGRWESTCPAWGRRAN